MKLKLLSIFTIVVALTLISASSGKVHTIGDSTMANYDESATITRGWGMYFGQFLTNGWTSMNYAKGGRDSYGGYNELWQTAKKNVKEGDYVIIQFAHNDEKNNGMDGYALQAYYNSIGNTSAAAAVDLRGTVPSTTFKQNLAKIVDEVKAMGAYPLLVAPVCRSYFTGSKIRRNGRHDLGDSFSVLTETGIKTNQSVPSTDHTMDYPYHMHQLAIEKDVPFIDLTSSTAELYESYGDAKCHEYLFDGDGSTHFNTTGALLVARKCAELMKAQGILTDAISLPSDLSVNPSSADMGEAYRGQSLRKELTLNGFSLTPEQGTVTICSSDGITLSTDKTNWQSTLSIDYQAGTLVQTFYAQITLEEAGETNGTITITQGEKVIEIPVKAVAVTLEGGTEVKAYWRLEKDDSYELTGPATIIPETWEGMYVQRYANPNANTVWPEWTGYEATRKMQRNLLTGDAWPSDEIDDNPNRYIEFGIEPNKGNTLKIDSIGLFVCGAGGNGMMCHIYYSTDNFETRSTIYAPSKMVANTPEAISVQPVISLNEGQKLLLRIYPWYNGASTSKTICISDVCFHGIAIDSEDTGIRVYNSQDKTSYIYNIEGKRLQRPQKGLNIVCQRMDDGSFRMTKYINQ